MAMNLGQHGIVKPINGYHVHKKLGQGGFGTCFLVSKGGRYYAMKKMTPRPTETEQVFEDAQNEVSILKGLNHINIVSYVEAFLVDLTVHIVMEYCNGGDLHDVLRKKLPLDISEIMKWFIQLCSALRYVHSRGIIHRDVKPTNIFLTASKNVKLGDFGIAKVLERRLSGISLGSTIQLSAAGFYPYAATMCGTVGYMAPEVSTGRYNNKIDVWSAGRVLGDLCNNQSWMLPNATPNYRSHVKELFSAMLNKNPVYRAGMEDILNHPFVRSFQE